MAFMVSLLFATLLLQTADASDVKKESTFSILTSTREEPDGFKSEDAFPLMQTKIDQLEARIEQLTAAIEAKSQLENQLIQIQADMADMKREVIQKETYDKNRPLMAIPKGITLDVAFSAYTTPTPLKLQENDTIIFDRVLVNRENGYDSTTGVFTVPISGVYRFSFQLATTYNFVVIVQLFVNEEDVLTIVDGYNKPESTGVYSLTGGDLIINVYGGDKVRLLYEGGDALFNRYSTFSGVLLYVN